MEGLWSVAFHAPGRQPWHGVAVFVGENVFGGDTFFYWIGNFTMVDRKLEGTMELTSHTGNPVSNSLGDKVANYSLRISAIVPEALEVGSSFTAVGPRGLTATLTRRG